MKYLDRYIFFIINKLSITRAETLVMSFLLFFFIAGLVLIATSNYQQGQNLLMIKENQFFLGKESDSLFAEDRLREWKKKPKIEAINNNKKYKTYKTFSSKSKSKPTFTKRDINQMTKEELVKIKGIGKWTARKILDLKSKNGGKIDSMVQIAKIKGMRSKIFNVVNRHFEVKSK